ncbi:MAG: hypothetical protein F9K23_16120 [Bacteroidetes bacterium]|nr:MAG: hypothetical protein F9K23_16120 [Bacteroidota bacterium]
MKLRILLYTALVSLFLSGCSGKRYSHYSYFKRDVKKENRKTEKRVRPNKLTDYAPIANTDTLPIRQSQNQEVKDSIVISFTSYYHGRIEKRETVNTSHSFLPNTSKEKQEANNRETIKERNNRHQQKSPNTSEQEKETHWLAYFSFALGLAAPLLVWGFPFSLFSLMGFVFGMVAFIAAIVALVKISKHSEEYDGTVFAILGMVFSMLGMMLFIIQLASILLLILILL